MIRVGVWSTLTPTRAGCTRVGGVRTFRARCGSGIWGGSWRKMGVGCCHWGCCLNMDSVCLMGVDLGDYYYFIVG